MMGIANIILVATGIITILIGIGAFLNPNIARFINFPAGPRLKATIALVIGIITLSVGIFVQISG